MKKKTEDIKNKVKKKISEPYAEIHYKMNRIKEIRIKLNAQKTLYNELRVLMEEVLPYFIKVTSNSFKINRSIRLGDKTYQIYPSFYDLDKVHLTSQNWKSTAHALFTIE
jgi:hypothetical protein